MYKRFHASNYMKDLECMIKIQMARASVIGHRSSVS